MTNRQQFTLGVLGIIVPAVVTLATVYLNGQQAKANAQTALRQYDSSRSRRLHNPPRRSERSDTMPEPTPVMAPHTTDMATFQDSVDAAIARKVEDTAMVIVQPTAIGKLLGAKARSMTVKSLRRK